MNNLGMLYLKVTNNRQFLNIYYFFKKILLIIALVSVISLILIDAKLYSLNLEYVPYNGTFQTFNPLRRMFEGEIPGRDFNPYLGLGPTYLNAFITYLLGRNFAASKFSTYFISLFLHLNTFIILFFLSGFTIRKSIIASSFVITTISFDVKRLAPLWELAGPGNSNIGIRSALPFLTSLAVLLLFKFWRRYPKTFYCIVGCLTGVQPLWSNDYGVPSCLTLTLIIILDLFKQERAGKLFKATVFFASTFIAFFVGAYMLTGGHLNNWLRDNFSGVALDQFWYFMWYNEQKKIFALKEVFPTPLFYLYIGSIIIILLHVLTKNYKIKYLLLSYIGITVLGAGVLSSVGGATSVHYYLSTILVSFFILPLSVYFLFSNSEIKFRQRTPAKINKYYINKRNHFILIVLLVFFTTAPVVNTIEYKFFLPTPSVKNGFFWVKELGGWLPNKWEHAIKVARNIDKDFSSKLPTERILSTYSSGMDVVAGAINPTEIDYIIHALGNHAKARYLEQFKSIEPKYITTLREDFTKWETWVRRTNWWFYREFFPNYQPVEATFYNIIWERLESSKDVNRSQAICRVIQESNNKVNLNISTEADKNNDIYYVELALKYHLEVEHSGIPLIGGRGLVNATEKETALTRPIAKDDNRSYGMPPSHNNWHIPIEHRLGTISVLEIKGYPENRSKLIVEACQARLFAPVDSFAVTRSLTPANLSDANWKNGILISKDNSDFSYTGFITNDKEALPELYPGMNIDFTSGRRKIIEIKDNQVWVTGPKLEPLIDGYPNRIIVKLQ